MAVSCVGRRGCSCYRQSSLPVQRGAFMKQKQKTLAERNAVTAKIMLAPLLTVLLVLGIFPGIYLVWTSLTDLQMNNASSGNFIWLSNYLALVTDSSIFGSALLKTLLFCLAALPIQFVLGYVIAKFFMAAVDMKGTGFLRTVYMFPLMITPLSVGLFWNYLLNPRVGAVNFLLQSANLPLQEWLSDSSTAFPCIIGIYLWQWTPYVAMLIQAGLLSIPGELYESARADGAGFLHITKSIDLPMLKKVLGISAILSLVQIVQTFELVLATTNGGPGTSTLVSAYAIYRDAFKYFQNGRACAEAVVLMVITTAISQVLAKYVLKEED